MWLFLSGFINIAFCVYERVEVGKKVSPEGYHCLTPNYHTPYVHQCNGIWWPRVGVYTWSSDRELQSLFTSQCVLLAANSIIEILQEQERGWKRHPLSTRPAKKTRLLAICSNFTSRNLSHSTTCVSAYSRYWQTVLQITKNLIYGSNEIVI